MRDGPYNLPTGQQVNVDRWWVFLRYHEVATAEIGDAAANTWRIIKQSVADVFTCKCNIINNVAIQRTFDGGDAAVFTLCTIKVFVADVLTYW